MVKLNADKSINSVKYEDIEKGCKNEQRKKTIKQSTVYFLNLDLSP